MEGNEYATRAVINLQARISFYQARPHEAEQYSQQVATASTQDIRHKVQALLNLGTIAFEHNQLKLAQEYADSAYQLVQERGDQVLLTETIILLARLKHTQGETVFAQQMLQEQFSHVHIPPSVRQLRAWIAWLALMAGDISTVQGWYSTYS